MTTTNHDDHDHQEDYRCEGEKLYGRYYCRRCACDDKWKPASECFSMGIYAGMYCGPCWAADGRNHDRPFDPMDAGESYGDEDL